MNSLPAEASKGKSTSCSNVSSLANASSITKPISSRVDLFSNSPNRAAMKEKIGVDSKVESQEATAAASTAATAAAAAVVDSTKTTGDSKTKPQGAAAAAAPAQTSQKVFESSTASSSKIAANSENQTEKRNVDVKTKTTSFELTKNNQPSERKYVLRCASMHLL